MRRSTIRSSTASRTRRPWQGLASATETASEPIGILNPLDAARRHLRATLLAGPARRRSRATCATAPRASASSRSDAPSGPRETRTGRSPTNRGGSRSRWRASDGPHWSVPEKLRGADFFDAKGLVETLVSPWIPSDELLWTLLRSDALTPGAAAAARTRSGRLIALAGLVSGAEREKHGIHGEVFVGEILIDELGARRASVRLPVVLAAAADHGRPLVHAAQGADLGGRRDVRARARASRTWSRCGCSTATKAREFPKDSVKTTIRLTFRSPERTLLQDEVNREVRRLADELAARLGVRFAG